MSDREFILKRLERGERSGLRLRKELEAKNRSVWTGPRFYLEMAKMVDDGLVSYRDEEIMIGDVACKRRVYRKARKA